jgi:glycosyltransferase involved in cell wall biosynthesis
VKVLFLNRYAGAFGGVEAYVHRAAAGLSERGVECILGRIEDRGPGSDAYLGPFAGSFRRDDEAALAEEVSRIAPDVVFLHKLGNTRAFLPPRSGPRLVRYVHDHDICCPRRHKYYAWGGAICARPAGAFCLLDAGFLERRGAAFALRSPSAFFDELAANRRLDLLLVGSRFMREELLANGFDPRKVAVLPPATPPAPGGGTGAAHAGHAQESAHPATAPVILYVGQLIRGKGVDILLEAFAMLRRDRPKLGLVVAGAGNADGQLREQAGRLGVGDAIRFEGMVGEAELDRLYAGAALLAVPSRWPEPFGMVGLEAMRRGIPVAASAAGGIPDWLEDGVTGFLAKPGDPRSLAAAIARILDDPGLARRMGEAGRAKAERDFSFSGSMDALITHLSGGGA